MSTPAAQAAERLRATYSTRSADEHHAREHETHRGLFARHQITERSEGRWHLAPRDAQGRVHGDNAGEVVVLDEGLVLVHGDLGFAAFGYHRVATARPEETVAWIGARASAADGPADKLTRAMEDDLGWDRDPAVFREEAIALLLDDSDEPLSPKEVELAAEALEEAFVALEDSGHVGHAIHLLHAADKPRELDSESLSGLGRVIHRRVYRGHAFLARLTALLEAERAATLPPAPAPSEESRP